MRRRRRGKRTTETDRATERKTVGNRGSGPSLLHPPSRDPNSTAGRRTWRRTDRESTTAGARGRVACVLLFYRVRVTLQARRDWPWEITVYIGWRRSRRRDDVVEEFSGVAITRRQRETGIKWRQTKTKTMIKHHTMTLSAWGPPRSYRNNTRGRSHCHSNTLVTPCRAHSLVTCTRIGSICRWRREGKDIRCLYAKNELTIVAKSLALAPVQT